MASQTRHAFRTCQLSSLPRRRYQTCNDLVNTPRLPYPKPMEGEATALTPELRTKKARQALHRRDGSGLTLDQKRLISSLALHGDLYRAAEECNIKRSKAAYWLSNSPAFKAAIDNLFTKPLVMRTGMRLVQILPRAADVMEEAVEANQPVKHDVTCPECDHPFTVTLQAPEWATRLRASEALFRVHGLGQTSKLEVEGKIEHKHSLSLEDRLALARLRRDQPVPPAVEESLRDRGLLQEGTVEAEFSEIEPDLEGPEEATE